MSRKLIDSIVELQFPAIAWGELVAISFETFCTEEINMYTCISLSLHPVEVTDVWAHQISHVIYMLQLIIYLR